MGLEPDCMVFNPGSVALYIGTVDKVLLSCGFPMGGRISFLPRTGADIRLMTPHIHQERRKGFITRIMRLWVSRAGTQAGLE